MLSNVQGWRNKNFREIENKYHVTINKEDNNQIGGHHQSVITIAADTENHWEGSQAVRGAAYSVYLLMNKVGEK